jgi:hypothetical protein
MLEVKVHARQVVSQMKVRIVCDILVRDLNAWLDLCAQYPEKTMYEARGRA